MPRCVISLYFAHTCPHILLFLTTTGSHSSPTLVTHRLSCLDSACHREHAVFVFLALHNGCSCPRFPSSDTSHLALSETLCVCPVFSLSTAGGHLGRVPLSAIMGNTALTLDGWIRILPRSGINGSYLYVSGIN